MSTLAPIIDELHSLPTPRGVALELMRLAGREDASISDLANIVRADPALTVGLIRAANRGITGGRAGAGLLNEAVLRLGFSATRQIALGFSLVNNYRSGHCAAFDYAAFWTGSLLRGVASQAVATRAGGLDAQEAFGCGLLADIGRLALATARPQEYASLLAIDSDRGALLRRREQERFATDHAELGVALLERWKLPETLVTTVREYQAILDHTAGHDAPQFRRAWMIVLAEALAQGTVKNAPAAWQQVALDAAAHLGLDSDALNALAADTVSGMSEWAPMLALPVPAVTAADYQEYENPTEDPCGNSMALDIVLVDDNESDLELARNMLETVGHRVISASSGDAALAAIASALPQMVITDWDMPDMDGAALCRALRATRMGRDLYLIMYTGRDNDHDLVAGIAAGADDFIAKSASTDVLLARVAAGARASRRTRELAGEVRENRRLAVELATTPDRRY